MPSTSESIGRLFPVHEASMREVIDGLGPWLAVASDPPWSALSVDLRPPVDRIDAGNMELAHLDELVRAVPDAAEVVVGIGGGTALDTAKYLAWQTGKKLVQVPTIASVDAGFTDAVGVRDAGRVKYVGNIEPEVVVIDLDLIAAAPKRLNRAGIGDILSCKTGLFDWRLAADSGQGVAWDDRLADLGRTLLNELYVAADDVGAVSTDGLRFLLSAYRRIGAACAAAGHSRFEEGSEHFLGYVHEYLSGDHLVHGELISMAVVAMVEPEMAENTVPATTATTASRPGSW